MGMLATATSYDKSFCFEELKHYDPESGRMQVVTSTQQSNWRSSMEMGMAYLSMEQWESYGQGHTAEGGKELGTEPGGMDECKGRGCVKDNFGFVEVGFPRIKSMEGFLEVAGVTEYTRFICGYHIHGAVATAYDKRLCALDWYAQTTEDRETEPNVWDHFLILDQVCPTQCWYAKVYERKGRYEGWYDHAIGLYI